jgi:S1-C subfamily serine protease
VDVDFRSVIDIAQRRFPPLATRLAMAAGVAVLAGSLPLRECAGATAQPRAVTPRGDLPTEERAIIGIFERSKRSVVHISTSERVLDLWTRNVSSIPRGTGSGFVWDDQGSIVTNYHVIADAAEARVRLNDGRDYPATLIGASPAHDLAVLRIRVPSDRPPSLPLGTSRDLKVGQRVYAIGNPFGLDWSLSTGIVSALDRSLSGERGGVEHLIQTDAAINPGNSGGPLLDSAGRLVGVNTAIYSPSGASAGVGFAVPVDTVNRVVPELIATGKYTPPVLGVDTDEGLRELLSRRLGVEGAPVLRVTPNSPAAGAGLRAARIGSGRSVVPGDIIVAINDRPVPTVAKFLAVLDDFAAGDKVKLTVWREGRVLIVEVVLVAGR